MKTLTIPIVSKDEFQKILLEHLTSGFKDSTVENIIEDLLLTGFPKLDYEHLNDSLSKMIVYLPVIAVDVGDKQYIWVVSGNRAIIVRYENILRSS